MSNERVWDEILARSPNDTEPEAPFVNFVICNLTSVYYKDSGKPVPRDRVQFLDIGCGKNARHTRWLERQGFHVTAVDISHEALAHFHCDIADLECEPNHFACVVDIKTLCAVEKPPLDKIYSWVQPNFFFYSMCPTDRHLREEGGTDVTQGLPYMRRASKEEIRDLFHMYKEVRIREYLRPCSIDGWLSTWCIEARK